MIDAEKATPDMPPVARMADLLGVSRSGYYAWAARQADDELGPRAARRADLTVKIKVAHDASDGVNGAPRILADLRADGEVVSRKTVAKLMRDNGIRGISPRPWRPVTTIADQNPHAIPDVVERRFDRGALNVVWTSDITYLTTGQGWLYLCAVRDGCSRRVLGYAFADNVIHPGFSEGSLTGRMMSHGSTKEVPGVNQIAAACPEVAVLRNHVRLFAKLLKPRKTNSARLDEWIRGVQAADLPHLLSFARGLQQDHAAVVAAVTTPHHNGKTEGANSRTKMIKRQMYGRVGFQLLDTGSCWREAPPKVRQSRFSDSPPLGRPLAANGGGTSRRLSSRPVRRKHCLVIGILEMAHRFPGDGCPHRGRASELVQGD